MAERIVIRQKGVLRDLLTPQGTVKVLGASTSAEELILEEHDAPPTELPEIQFLTHMICIVKGTVPFSIFWKERVEKSARIGPGSVFLSTAQLQSGFRWEGRFQAVVLSIGIQTMERALPEPFTKRPVELTVLRAGGPDPVLEHLIGALSSEFERHESSGRLVLESIGNATALYLAQRYGALAPRLPGYKSGLSRERLSRVIDYIETYLANDLSGTELSNLACLSPYHFGKMFKRTMKLNVHQYVTTRRIERAKELLSSRILTLSDIALSVGFQDQSQFTTIFKRHVGVTPGRFRHFRGL